MPTKILLIENDSAFAAGISESLETSGFDVRITGDGKLGLELAREWAPAAIVLCVELPGMSGYLVCQKLKKDDALRSIPLVLTSAEASEETFEKHRTLKARAEEYLLKPYVPAALIEKLAGLVGLPEGDGLGDPAGHGEDEALEPEAEPEEIVSLEEAMGLEALSPEPEGELPALELEALPDEPAGDVRDEDLALLDHAFDDIALPAPERPGEALDLALGGGAPASEPADDLADLAPAAREPDAFHDDDLHAPMHGVAGLDADALPPLDEHLSLAPRAARAADLEGSGALARRAEAAEAELAELRDQVDALEARAQAAEDDRDAARQEAAREAERARAAEDELLELRERLLAAERRAEEADGRAEEARAEARRAADEAAAAADAAGKVDALEREVDELRTELVVARGEAEGARGEVEKRTAELRRRVAELEATALKNEERVLKAYQKIKGDEKVKDKVRKALAIAAQLLEEGAGPAADPAGERERRPAPVVPIGRE